MHLNQQEEYIQKQSQDGGFLQSKAWHHFQEVFGKKVVYFEDGDWRAYSTVHALTGVGTYGYISRGPVIDEDSLQKNREKSRAFFENIVRQAKAYNAAWIRVEPISQTQLDWMKSISKYTVRKSHVDMQPRELLIMPIDREEADLLSCMKSKTRYNIRLAEKKGVRIFTSRDQKYIDIFCDLVEITAKRDGIVPHSRAYYQKMLTDISEDVMMLYLAEYQGEIIAANAVVFFGTYATYLHGASSNVHREVMAPTLLQWRQIQDARKKGCTRYDFGGVAIEGTHDRWSGITRFKQGFSPQQKPTVFVGSYDIVLAKNRYTAYLVLKGLKQLFRKMIQK